MAFRNINSALVSTEKEIRKKISTISFPPIQTEVAIAVAADALTPSPSNLMALKSVNNRLVSVGKDMHKKVSTMPLPSKIAVATVVGVVAAPVVVSAAVTTIGFTSAGITSGSMAATFMSSYGGYVTAGSACALMQSIGAAGLGITGTAISVTAGGALGYTIGKTLTKSQEDDSLVIAQEQK
ncbi:1366_t:CDS:2 [Paraglomus occultum]|uniref:1366_t:CDS:1 n=1 Tax=Paraglomus occultum TaxID=144539 RepID=A0A9N9BU96_9GLOM|nr:1366_t:CDS:2 [Paraglomus occultum]